MADKPVVLEVEAHATEDRVMERGLARPAHARVRRGRLGAMLDRKAPRATRLRMVLVLSLASWALVLAIVLALID